MDADPFAFSMSCSVQRGVNFAKDDVSILTRGEKELCEQAYNEFRTNANSYAHFRRMINSLGLALSDEEMNSELRRLGHCEGHVFTYDLFISFLTEAKRRKLHSIVNEEESETLDAFVLLGGQPDRSGCVNTSVLKATILSFDLLADVDKMIEEVDEDQSGEIDFDEFSHFYHELRTKKVRRPSNAEGGMNHPLDSTPSTTGDLDHDMDDNLQGTATVVFDAMISGEAGSHKLHGSHAATPHTGVEARLEGTMSRNHARRRELFRNAESQNLPVAPPNGSRKKESSREPKSQSRQTEPSPAKPANKAEPAQTNNLSASTIPASPQSNHPTPPPRRGPSKAWVEGGIQRRSEERQQLLAQKKDELQHRLQSLVAEIASLQEQQQVELEAERRLLRQERLVRNRRAGREPPKPSSPPPSAQKKATSPRAGAQQKKEKPSTATASSETFSLADSSPSKRTHTTKSKHSEASGSSSFHIREENEESGERSEASPDRSQEHSPPPSRSADRGAAPHSHAQRLPQAFRHPANRPESGQPRTPRALADRLRGAEPYPADSSESANAENLQKWTA